MFYLSKKDEDSHQSSFCPTTGDGGHWKCLPFRYINPTKCRLSVSAIWYIYHEKLGFDLISSLSIFYVTSHMYEHQPINMSCQILSLPYFFRRTQTYINNLWQTERSSWVKKTNVNVILEYILWIDKARWISASHSFQSCTR